MSRRPDRFVSRDDNAFPHRLPTKHHTYFTRHMYPSYSAGGSSQRFVYVHTPALCFEVPSAILACSHIMLFHSPPLFAPLCAVQSPLAPFPRLSAPRRNRRPTPTWFPRGDRGVLPVVGGGGGACAAVARIELAITYNFHNPPLTAEFGSTAVATCPPRQSLSYQPYYSYPTFVRLHAARLAQFWPDTDTTRTLFVVPHLSSTTDKKYLHKARPRGLTP